MEKDIRIQSLRISFIWAEVDVNLTENPVFPHAQYKFLRNSSAYAATFNDIQTEQMDLIPPWDNLAGQHFWYYYLEQPKKTLLDGQKAWKSLIPFRKKIPLKAVPKPGIYLYSVEGFFYPYGSGLVITVNLGSDEGLPLKDCAQMALKVKHEEEFDVTWQGGTPEKLYLFQLAEKGMRYIWELALGKAEAQARIFHRENTFTVGTFIKGTGMDPSVPPQEGGEILHALEAMTAWDEKPLISWKQVPLKLDGANMIPLRSSETFYKGHLVYARKRGRTVWLPALIGGNTKINHELACYHRNLALNSLQVESLCILVRAAAKEIAEGNWVNIKAIYTDDHLKRAADILGRIYSGKDTYRSKSSLFHIHQNKFEDDINKVNEKFGKQKLFN